MAQGCSRCKMGFLGKTLPTSTAACSAHQTTSIPDDEPIALR
jgi:hypothetical protein